MKKVIIEINEPKTCGACPFYSESDYQCHNERGYQARCSMGYMDEEDMRDKSFRNSKYYNCKLTEKSKKHTKVQN